MQDEKPLISIVIPVYNVEVYLRRCIDSILNQKYTNLEIILVDDGATDKSPQICDEYAKNDSRILVIHKHNEGVSSARNIGTNRALGKYISYIDSDDIISPDYISYLFNLITKYKTKISMCRILDCIDKVLDGDEKKEEILLDGTQALKMLFYQKEFTTSVSGKLYSTQLMKKFEFPINCRYEDLMMIYKILYESNSIIYGQCQLYYYMHHDGSFMDASYNKNSLNLKSAADELFLFVEDKCPSALQAARSQKFSSYCQLYVLLSNEMSNSHIENELWVWIVKNRISILKDKNVRYKNRFAVLCTMLGRKKFSEISNLMRKYKKDKFNICEVIR